MPATSATVLLVEDEALVALVAEDQLRSLGFAPISVASAQEARDYLTNSPTAPAFAVIDVGLPDVRGDDLASELRSKLPETKIIIASGYDPLLLRQRFRSDDGVSVMSKPYSEDDLKRAVASLGLTL